MSLLPQFKIGDCSIDGCGLKDTQGRKVGKNFICITHYNSAKQKEQIAKANLRNNVRGLLSYQKVEGIVSDLQELTIDLDRVYSRWLRLSNTGSDLKCDCYTCSTRKIWTAMQCGHFIKRGESGLRWEPANTKPQCNHCNVDLRGNLEVYRANLERDNQGIVEWLEEQARQVNNTTRTDLKQMLTEYQSKLNVLENIKLK